jgi:ABC-type sugar transport system ATPase subunit
MSVSDVIVELKNIRKEFPGVVALDGVNLTLRKGRVHALVGENGAGKSTLMKILSGSYVSYDGEVLFGGESVRFHSEHDALQKGIAIVPQELNPIPEMSIAENIFLGREPMKRRGIVDRKARLRQAAECLQALGLDYDPATKMWQLSVAQRQMVEIIKAISRNSRVIILDEPTSALTAVETRYLFDQIASLKARGIAIVFISHKLDEVFKISDDVTVLRDGQMISTGLIEDVDQDQLIARMVGREVRDIYPPLHAPVGGELIRVEHLTAKGVFADVSFEVHRGEIVGFAGMMGAGRSEIARAVFGLDPFEGGSILFDGKPARIKSTQDAIRRGIAMVTEDRSVYGFVGVRSVKDNIILPNLDLFSRRGVLNFKAIKEKVEDICRKLSVKAASIETLVGTLSGGNQQKVVLSKWLVRNVKFLILDEPTRGIDVGAKQEIYRLIAKLAEDGMGILIIASEMPEVLAMSHRVKVVAGGRIIGELTRGEATQDKVMKMIVEGVKTA